MSDRMVRPKRCNPEDGEDRLRKQPKKGTLTSGSMTTTRQLGVHQLTLTQMAQETDLGVSLSIMELRRTRQEAALTTGALSFPTQPIIVATTDNGIDNRRRDDDDNDDDDEFSDPILQQNVEHVIAAVEAAEKEHQKRTSSIGVVASQYSPSENGLTQDTNEDSIYHPKTDVGRKNQAVESSDENDDDGGDDDGGGDDDDDDVSTNSDYSEERWTQRPAEFKTDDVDDGDDDDHGEESDGDRVLDEIGEEPEEPPEETKYFLQALTQCHDQDEVCERTDKNEVWLSQQGNNTQSQPDDVVELSEMLLLTNHQTATTSPHRPPMLQTSLIDYFATTRTQQPKYVTLDMEKSVEITDPSGIARIFKVGETYGIKPTLANKDAALKQYYFTIEDFEKLSGPIPRWGGKYDKKCGVYKHLQGTFIGKEQAKKLARSPIFKNIRKSDRGKVIQVNGCPHLVESEPIRLRLLGGPLKRKPAPHLLYEAHGKSINDFHVAYFFYRSQDWVYKRIDGEIRALDLFAGVGGMDLGLEMAGIRVTHVVDKQSRLMASFGNYAREMFRRKGEADVKVFDECVYDFLENAQMAFTEYHESNGAAMQYPKPGEIDHIHSSSPCQAFSLANINGGKNDEANSMLIFVIMLYVRFYRPKTVSFENVQGLLFDKNRHYLQKLVRLFIAEGYQVRPLTMNAARYGDPQCRLRVILFGSRDDHKLPDPPLPTHGPGTEREFISVKEAFKGLEDIKPSKSSKRILIENGTKAVFNHCEDRRKIHHRDNKIKKLEGDCPAGTILCQRPVIHPELDRLITCRERARAQSFPDDFRFFGTQPDIRNSIGNAVPVKLATAIGRAIRDSYNYHLKSDVAGCYFSKERKELDRNKKKGWITPLSQSCLLTTKK